MPSSNHPPGKPQRSVVEAKPVHRAKPLVFGDFASKQDPINVLNERSRSNQSRYLLSYLRGLGARKFILEPNYFDLDYLDEFARFYAARGCTDICQRVHYFADNSVTRELLTQALADASADADEPGATAPSSAAISTLRHSYLGFSVLKPIRHPFGRTVLRWYPDQTPEQARETATARQYECHLAGLKLTVAGLAWQQQDAAVASCATVGVWSILHSSAFDYRHAIPTTAQITLAAKASAKRGTNAFPSVEMSSAYGITPVQSDTEVFPSTGLQTEELLKAIKHQHLNPIKIDGDLPPVATRGGQTRRLFSRENFASTCAAFIRSGYPVLLLGSYDLSQPIGHVVCVVGFRSPLLASQQGEAISLMDEAVPHLYLHDDNSGPNIRFKIVSSPLPANETNGNVCQLVSEAPPYKKDGDAIARPVNQFIPFSLVVATHQELRLSSHAFYREGKHKAETLRPILELSFNSSRPSGFQLSYSCRFMLLKTYLAAELAHQIPDKARLTSARLSLQERVPPLSLHIGILRLGIPGSSLPLLDIIYDTTETSQGTPFCCVSYHAAASELFVTNPVWAENQLGMEIIAY